MMKLKNIIPNCPQDAFEYVPLERQITDDEREQAAARFGKEFADETRKLALDLARSRAEVERHVKEFYEGL